ncbi:class I SAM-dependent methyltransferase [Brevibacillus laterosporus]|uniref:Class I SAM-dependent methyltransferase n=2 Tax=Brevibacillus laterosporus TaxID=1465 RepID=A0AAP8QA34_BRELA|nr:class I SAM-dependent methyltransferase [Brevibacillus laterosporus]PPA93083.1 class I SAM-dependent methyltransferase [Brevibacillus laterosporus]
MVGDSKIMYLSPGLYHRIIRPRWFTKTYIHDHIKSQFTVENKIVLDFGCGTGANCCMFGTEHYYGIDPDVNRVQFAKRLYPNHTFTIFDGKRIPMHNQTVDLLLIVAVLHHISNEQISEYLSEFHRVLKPDGKIIIIEPYLSRKKKFNNWFMTRYDDGEYIRNEDDYLQLFNNQRYDCTVLKKFQKLLLYNEIFFIAVPKPKNTQNDNPFLKPSFDEGVIPMNDTSQGKFFTNEAP